MKHFSKVLLSFFITFSLILSGLSLSPSSVVNVSAATYCTDFCGSNIEAQNYSQWSSTVKSYIITKSSSYMVISGGNNQYSAFVEYYSTSTHALTLTKKIALELPVFGGFYESANYYFLVTGQTNTAQSSTTEIYRITKYDKSWKRISSVGLYDCNTTYPFDAGSCRMTDNGSYLIIRTCHEMYNGHQANVTIEVDMETMKITDSYTGVMNVGYGYVSHSFNQFVQLENNHIIAVDHGDAYPRSMVLLQYKTDVSTGKFVPGYYTQCNAIDVLSLQGAEGANATGATVGGFEISDSSYLVAGNSIVQDSNYSSRTTRNIYLCAVNKSTSAVKTTWLTNFPEGAVSTATPQLVKISDTKFMVLWSHNNKVYYVTIDGTGTATSRVFSYPGNLSDCKPLVTTKKIIWYTRMNDDMTFYEIPISTPQNIKTYSVCNGHDMSKTTVSGTTSTLVCPRCGKTLTMTNVDTNYNVWWNNTGRYGNYSSVPPTISVGETLYMWANYSQDATKNQEYIVEIGNPKILRLSNVNGVFSSFTAVSPGSTTIKVYSKWNPSKTTTKTVTVKAASSTVTDSDITVNGYQFNPSIGGIRTLYTVADTISGSQVIEAGLVYGLAPYATTGDMTVFSGSDHVYSYMATSTGKIASSLGSSGTSSYVMTLKQTLSRLAPTALTAKYYVRAYAELADGSYVYSDIYTYTLYDLADSLYQHQMMSTASKHNYLYTNILSVINTNYKAVTYNGSYGIVTP